MEEKDQIQHLYLKFISGQSTPAEMELLFYFFRVSGREELNELIATGLELKEELVSDEETERVSLQRIHDDLHKRVTKTNTFYRSLSSPWYFAIFIVAALILLVIYLHILLT